MDLEGNYNSKKPILKLLSYLLLAFTILVFLQFLRLKCFLHFQSPAFLLQSLLIVLFMTL
jgi:hypothetical protein